MLELFKTRLGTAICARKIPTSAHFHVQYMDKSDYAAQHPKLQRKHHCRQTGQPYHAAVEGERKIVLNHQLCITKSTDVVLLSLYSIIAL